MVKCSRIEDDHVGIDPDGSAIAARKQLFSQLQACQVGHQEHMIIDLFPVPGRHILKELVVNETVVKSLLSSPCLDRLHAAVDPGWYVGGPIGLKQDSPHGHPLLNKNRFTRRLLNVGLVLLQLRDRSNRFFPSDSGASFQMKKTPYSPNQIGYLSLIG